MKTYQVEQKTEEWLQLRKNKITGTSLKAILGSNTVRDNYFYEYLASRLSVGGDSEESDLDRGNRLESEAIQEFEKVTGKIVETMGFCEDDDCEFIGYSPDGLINNKGKYTEGVEVKCLSSARYVRAWVENEVPKDYKHQLIQAFIVNKDLKTLYFVLYDPRIAIHPIHIIEITRESLKAEIEECRDEQMKFLDSIEKKLSELIEI